MCLIEIRTFTKVFSKNYKYMHLTNRLYGSDTLLLLLQYFLSATKHELLQPYQSTL